MTCSKSGLAPNCMVTLNVESISIRSNGAVPDSPALRTPIVRMEHGRRPVPPGAVTVMPCPVLPDERRPSLVKGPGVPRGRGSQRAARFSLWLECAQRGHWNGRVTLLGKLSRPACAWRKRPDVIVISVLAHA